MTSKPQIVLGLGVTLFVVSACGLSQQQCLDGDWDAIGYRDGTLGRSQDFAANHVKACEKYDISVDVNEWETARQSGLLVYCSPASAFDLGKRGRRLNAVCDPAELEQLKAANLKGLIYYEKTQDIKELRAERSDLIDQLANLSDEDENLISQIRAEIFRIDFEISRIEFQRRRYESL